MTLREKAQGWLDGYKNGVDDVQNRLDIEDWAAIVGEYLHDTEGNDSKIKKLKDTCETLHEDNRKLQDKIVELIRESEAIKNSAEMSRQRVTFLEGKVSALEFSVRCNGISGAEVDE